MAEAPAAPGPAVAQWDLPLAQALHQEGAGGYAVVHAEGLVGAARFAAGAGRHGQVASPESAAGPA